MHAFLLISQSIENLKLKIKNLATEQGATVIPFELQKIEDVRNLKKLVKFSFAEKTAIVINDIDKITTEAANAFLKNLEEPNSNLIYILTASNLNNVLPTITSRCEIVKMLNAKCQMLNKNRGYRDGLNIKDRDEAIKFVEDLLHIDYQKRDLKNMENYLETLQNLKANGNVSLQLTSFVVKMDSQR